VSIKSDTARYIPATTLLTHPLFPVYAVFMQGHPRSCRYAKRLICKVRKGLCPLSDADFMDLLERWALTSGTPKSPSLLGGFLKSLIFFNPYSAMDLSGDVAFLLREDTDETVVDYILGKTLMSKRTCRALRQAHGQYRKRHVYPRHTPYVMGIV